jgi:hypothetical protein
LAHGLGDLSLRHISAVESSVIGWHGQKAIQIPGATITRSVKRLRVGWLSGNPLICPACSVALWQADGRGRQSAQR